MLTVWEVARAGLVAVWDYVALHVLTCLIPAFLLAGAMVAFSNKEAIMARLGAAASKPANVTMAAGASFFVAACSCTVIPVSSGIYHSGAGIGAAFILLWVAPASNLLSLRERSPRTHAPPITAHHDTRAGRLTAPSAGRYTCSLPSFPQAGTRLWSQATRSRYT